MNRWVLLLQKLSQMYRSADHRQRRWIYYFPTLTRVWLTAENACVGLSHRSETDRRNQASCLPPERVGGRLNPALKAEKLPDGLEPWPSDVLSLENNGAKCELTAQSPREAFQLSEKTSSCWLPTAAYLIQVCPPLVRAPVLGPLFWHDEDLGRGREPREHRDQELLLAHPRDL